MMSREMLVKRLRTNNLGSFTVVGWAPLDVYELWAEVVSYKDQRRFKVACQGLAVRTTRVTISVNEGYGYNGAPIRVPGLVALLLVSVCAVGLALLPREATPPPEPGEQCWEWDRPNHTLIVRASPEFFEMAHDAYRLTGKEPDRLTECTK
jgi:hypothetical protein